MSFLRTMLVFTAVLFFGVVFVGTVAPALGQLTSFIEPRMAGGSGIGPSYISGLESILFTWMPLLFVGGFALLLFVSASGLRGSSFRP